MKFFRQVFFPSALIALFVLVYTLTQKLGFSTMTGTQVVVGTCFVVVISLFFLAKKRPQLWYSTLHQTTAILAILFGTVCQFTDGISAFITIGIFVGLVFIAYHLLLTARKHNTLKQNLRWECLPSVAVFLGLTAEFLDHGAWALVGISVPLVIHAIIGYEWYDQQETRPIGVQSPKVFP